MCSKSEFFQNFSILQLKFYKHFVDTPCVNLLPDLGTILLLSASLKFPVDISGNWNCAVFLLLWLAYVTLTNTPSFIHTAANDKITFIFKCWIIYVVYVYITFSLLIYLPMNTGQFFYLGCCVECSNGYETVDISWTFAFYLLWT